MPLRSKTTLIFPVALLAMPLKSIADTISPDLPNAAFAPVSIVEDHPQCSGTGESAFEIPFEVQLTTYLAQVGRSDDQVVIDANSTEIDIQPQCFVTVVRGTDRMRMQTLCDPENSPARSRPGIVEQPPTLLLSGTLSFCQGPLSFRVIDSEWEIATDNGTETIESSGSLFHPLSGACIPRENANDPQVQITALVQGVSRSRSYRGVTESVPYFLLKLFNIPVVPETEDVAGIYAFAPVFLFPTVNGKSECVDGVCDVSFQRLERTPTSPSPVCW